MKSFSWLIYLDAVCHLIAPFQRGLGEGCVVIDAFLDPCSGGLNQLRSAILASFDEEIAFGGRECFKESRDCAEEFLEFENRVDRLLTLVQRAVSCLKRQLYWVSQRNDLTTCRTLTAPSNFSTSTNSFIAVQRTQLTRSQMEAVKRRLAFPNGKEHVLIG
jgi:hypothetical protein